MLSPVTLGTMEFGSKIDEAEASQTVNQPQNPSDMYIHGPARMKKRQADLGVAGVVRSRTLKRDTGERHRRRQWV
jgi:hypothetical protein